MFPLYPLNTFNSIKPLPFLITFTILLSQGRLYKIIQVSNPDALCAFNCKVNSRILLFLSLCSSPSIFKQKSKALLTQLSPSIAIVSFFYIYLIHMVLNRDYISQLIYSIYDIEIY